jgi:hypothetical protein
VWHTWQLDGQQILTVVILLAFGHGESGNKLAQVTVVAGLAAAALGSDRELIDLGGGQVVAVAHRFVYY